MCCDAAVFDARSCLVYLTCCSSRRWPPFWYPSLSRLFQSFCQYGKMIWGVLGLSMVGCRNLHPTVCHYLRQSRDRLDYIQRASYVAVYCFPGGWTRWALGLLTWKGGSLGSQLSQLRLKRYRLRQYLPLDLTPRTSKRNALFTTLNSTTVSFADSNCPSAGTESCDFGLHFRRMPTCRVCCAFLVDLSPHCPASRRLFWALLAERSVSCLALLWCCWDWLGDLPDSKIAPTSS